MPSSRHAPVPPDSSTWSLERRLPLLILALLACVVGAFSVAAYREVRASAVSRATDRLERLARELALSSARTGQARNSTLHALDTSAAVRAVLLPRGDRPSLAVDRPVAVPVPQDARTAGAPAVAALLEATRTAADSTLLGWELWTLDGERRYQGGPQAGGAGDSLALAAVRAAITPATDSVRRSPIYAVGRSVHLWTIAPVRVGGRTIGVLAERRRLGNSTQGEQAIRRLTGEEVDVMIGSRGATTWASLRGEPVAPAFTTPVVEDSAAFVTGVDGGRRYVVVARVPGSPWQIVLLQTEESVLRRPHEFLRRLFAVGLALLALGTVGAWLVGRHVARPLRQVTDAAAALAGGDFAQRVPVAGAAELAGLASTFNAMAAGLGEAQAALELRNVELQRANAAKGRFLAMMSHELRTPLNAIGGYAELLEMGLRGAVTPAQAEDLGRIRRSKDHLLGVISDILTHARSEAGTLPLALTTLPIAEVFDDAAGMVEPQFRAKGVRLCVEPVPCGVAVRGDRDKLQQILLNLLSNALKFTERDGEVWLSCVAAPDVVRLEVRDTGIGIPAERLSDIFEPFVQVDGSLTRRVGGTGLGLAIARDLATAMDGAVAVESTPGRGSRFALVLPTAESAVEVGASPSDAGARAVVRS